LTRKGKEAAEKLGWKSGRRAAIVVSGAQETRTPTKARSSPDVARGEGSAANTPTKPVVESPSGRNRLMSLHSSADAEGARGGGSGSGSARPSHRGSRAGGPAVSVDAYDVRAGACWAEGEPAPYLHLARAFEAMEKASLLDRASPAPGQAGRSCGSHRRRCACTATLGRLSNATSVGKVRIDGVVRRESSVAPHAVFQSVFLPLVSFDTRHQGVPLVLGVAPLSTGRHAHCTFYDGGVCCDVGW